MLVLLEGWSLTFRSAKQFIFTHIEKYPRAFHLEGVLTAWEALLVHPAICSCFAACMQQMLWTPNEVGVLDHHTRQCMGKETTPVVPWIAGLL